MKAADGLLAPLVTVIRLIQMVETISSLA